MEATKKLEAVTEEELLELKVALTKKLEAKDYGSLQSILKNVEQKQISYSLLKSTKIGKTLSDLKDLQSPDS